MTEPERAMQNTSINHAFQNTSHRGYIFFFVFLLALHLIPIWIFDYLPTVDGPLHLATAHALSQLDNSAFPIFSEFYEANWRIDTNQFIFVTLFYLVKVFPVLIAGKILISMYVILFPLSAFYAITSVSKNPWCALFLLFPFIFSRVFYMGFYNYSFGLAFFLLSLGYYLRYFRNPGARH